MKKLYLSSADRKFAGICGGLGEYFEKDPTLFRILFILITILSAGLGVFAYAGIWLVVPRKPKDHTRP